MKGMLPSCALCLPSSRFSPLMTTALYEKYSTSSNFYFSRQVDELLSNSCTKEVVQFHQALLFIDRHEFIKRQYLAEEFPQKILHLSEYYKFNRDLPRCFDRDLEKPLTRYYEGLKKVDFRRVKNALKKQQGISITSQHSQSSEQDSIVPLCSKFPSVLGELALEQSSDSVALYNICNEINSAFGGAKGKETHRYKGRFEEQARVFEAFIQREKGTNGFTKHKIAAKNHLHKQPLKSIGNLKPHLKNMDKQHLVSERAKKDAVMPHIINVYGKALQSLTNIGKYQSVKPRKFIQLGRGQHCKQHKSGRTLILVKNSQQQKKGAPTERLQRDNSKKSITKYQLGLKLEQGGKSNQTNENNNRNLGNRITSGGLGYKKEGRRSISIAKEKSRVHLEKSGRKVSLTSNTDRSISKGKQGSKEVTKSKIDKVVNKKLNVFR